MKLREDRGLFKRRKGGPDVHADEVAGMLLERGEHLPRSVVEVGEARVGVQGEESLGGAFEDDTGSGAALRGESFDRFLPPVLEQTLLDARRLSEDVVEALGLGHRLSARGGQTWRGGGMFN